MHAEKYQNEDNGIKDEFVFEENSVESEVWDVRLLPLYVLISITILGRTWLLK